MAKLVYGMMQSLDGYVDDAYERWAPTPPWWATTWPASCGA